jgi:hypothetical protein
VVAFGVAEAWKPSLINSCKKSGQSNFFGIARANLLTE